MSHLKMLVIAVVCSGMNFFRALLARISDSSTPCACAFKSASPLTCFGMLTIFHPGPQALGLIIQRHAFKSGPLLGCLLPTLSAGDCFFASPSNSCPASALFSPSFALLLFRVSCFLSSANGLQPFAIPFVLEVPVDVGGRHSSTFAANGRQLQIGEE
ncbi:hypothetical protein BJX66DRAFT_122717 [Aspergillus keveii]|uniref:Secreted protein n=1 Tax=Aspergillus keveii TaxID=714993 RepID=A0ABR4GCP7_9EURO